MAPRRTAAPRPSGRQRGLPPEPAGPWAHGAPARPGWGDHAQQAEEDTFHYPNCARQHEDLNQKDWLGLEEDILGAAETRGFRLSVLTGPVFRDSDRHLALQDGAKDVAIPKEFWKIAVMIDAATGKLPATGYVLSQGRMIRRLV